MAQVFPKLAVILVVGLEGRNVGVVASHEVVFGYLQEVQHSRIDMEYRAVFVALSNERGRIHSTEQTAHLGVLALSLFFQAAHLLKVAAHLHLLDFHKF